MGCDIHASVEREVYPERDGQAATWYTIAHLDWLPRDYALFGSLVADHSRGSHYDGLPGVAPARGKPTPPADDDSGDVGAACGDHTWSWLTPEEFAAALAIREKREPLYPVAVEYTALREYLARLADTGTAVRLVFSFDS